MAMDGGAVTQQDAGAEPLERVWERWDPGVPLRILSTEFSSIVDPIVAFIDEAREVRERQVVVLIPVVVPTHLRYSILHNQIDRVLTHALRRRTDVVVARVTRPLEPPVGGDTAEGDAPPETTVSPGRHDAG